MKKRIAKLTALMFTVALLALPGKAFSFWQMFSGVSTYSTSPDVCYDCPLFEEDAATNIS